MTVFNTEAANKAVIMDLSGVNPGQNMLKALRDQDKRRIKSAGQKVWEIKKEFASKAKVRRGRVTLFRCFWP